MSTSSPVLAPLALTVSFALAACGGSSSPPPAVEVGAARPAPAQPQEKKDDCGRRSPLLGMPAEREPGCAPEPTPDPVASCSDEATWKRAVYAMDNQQGACVELAGGARVAGAWHVNDSLGKKELMGTTCYYAKDVRFCRSLNVAGADVDKALQIADSSDLVATVEGGMLRVGVVFRSGEDYATAQEIVLLYGLDGRYLHTGVGTRVETEMDACTKEDVVSFSLTPDGKSLERRSEPRATFTAQPIDAKLLAKIKKSCTPAAGGVRVTTIPTLSR